MAIPTRQWTRQIGSGSDDDILTAAIDPLGNIIVGGFTGGQLGEVPNAGGIDAFVAKYDSSGEQLWIRQFGSEAFEQLSTLATDAIGNVYVGGFTQGQLGEEPSDGGNDAFLAKFDPRGNQLWIKQFGAGIFLSITALAINATGQVYVGGPMRNTEAKGLGTDAFLAKYDPQGAQLWLKEFGSTASDSVKALCTDSQGYVYVAGHTEGAVGDTPNKGRFDVFLGKYNAQGDQLWLEQFGSSDTERINAVTTDRNGFIYVGGVTAGKLGAAPNQRWDDAFVAKYSPQGDQLWIRQLGTSNFEGIRSVSTDGAGHLYVGGYTRGQLGEEPRLGGYDAFLAKYDANGEQLWLHQFGSSEDEGIQSITTDELGNIYAAGYAYGQMGSESVKGARDAFLAKFTDDTSAFTVDLLKRQLDELSTRQHQLTLDHETLLSRVQQLESQRDDTAWLELDLPLLQLAKLNTLGRGESRISVAEAKEIVAAARQSDGTISPMGKKTLAYIFARFTLTQGAQQHLLEAIS